MQSFKTAIRTISDSWWRASILARLRIWRRDGLGAKIVRNLQLEHFLPARLMKEILLAIHRCPISSSGSTNVLENDYLAECFKYIRMGGEIRGGRPSILGRAVERDNFLQWLLKTKFVHTDSQARDLLMRLTTSGSLSKNERLLLMSEFSAWITWREDGRDPDPFGFKPRMSAMKIRACIGLDPQRRNDSKPLVVLAYQNRVGLHIYRPTIADAGIHELFEPPHPNENNHGWTQTWPRTTSIAGFKPISRPEALHAPENMASIHSLLTRIVR